MPFNESSIQDEYKSLSPKFTVNQSPSPGFRVAKSNLSTSASAGMDTFLSTIVGECSNSPIMKLVMMPSTVLTTPFPVSTTNDAVPCTASTAASLTTEPTLEKN